MAVIIGLAFLLHWRVARGRSARLLEHDEAISLLAAAGKSKRMDRLYTELGRDRIQVIPAKEMQNLMRPTGRTGLADVLESLAFRDIHPPLYFVTLHCLQRLGVWSHVALRLLGACVLLAAAWIASRWIWPDAPLGAKLMGLAFMTATPVMVEVATELRQYALVYLGTILSFAALITYLEGRRPVRETIILMSLAPVLLLWSQFGTAVWMALALGVALTRLVHGPRVCRKVFVVSVLLAGVLLLPLALWRPYGLAVAARPAGGTISLTTLTEAVHAMLFSAARAWCSLPGRWHDLAAWPFTLVAVLVTGGVLVLARRAVIDQVLLCAAIGWSLVWIFGLAGGKIPQQAAMVKHLAPLVLCPLVVLVRSTSSKNRPWIRRVATVVIAAALMTHVGVGTWQLLTGLTPQPSVAALRSANCLMIDAPKRGHVLPLVARMKPESRVIIAPPAVAAADWVELDKLLPDDGLVLAEVDALPGGRRTPASQEVFDKLSRTYGNVAVLRKEPGRTITEFKKKRSASNE